MAAMNVPRLFGAAGAALPAELAAQLARWLPAAAAGDAQACFELGLVHAQGAAADLIEAHKWFNLAAASGHEGAAACRADIAEEMTAREIAEAQRRAREWLRAGERRVA